MATAATYQSFPTAPIERRRILTSSISWKAIFAGFFISILMYSILSAVGLAVGGLTLQSSAENLNSIPALSVGWLIVSAIISLLVGGFVSARVSNFETNKIGIIEGGITASMFFIAMALQAGILLGTAASGVISTVNVTSENIWKRPEVQNLVNEELSSFELRGNPAQIAQGALNRYALGDADGARNYLAANSNLSTIEINSRIDALNADLTALKNKFLEASGKAVSFAGGVLSIVLIFGTLAAILGGMWGVRNNRVLSLYSEKPRRVR